jgi:hypothetical protein
MKKRHLKILALLAAAIIFHGCNFSKSVNTNLLTGLTTIGDGLSCEEVYMSMEDGQIEKNTFIYGEEFDMNFSNIGGFTKVGEAVFPGLTLTVTNEADKVVMETEDLYANYSEGMDFSPLLLAATLTVATPIQSNNNYVLSVKIWDKEGKGTFTAKMPFEVVENDQIIIETNQTSFSEVYLFSGNSNKVITDQEVAFDEEVYLIIEGLTGFQEEEEHVFIGMSVNATDNAGNTILSDDDLLASYNETGIPVNELKNKIFATMTFTKGVLSNPVRCEVAIFDKKGEASITAVTDLSVY